MMRIARILTALAVVACFTTGRLRRPAESFADSRSPASSRQESAPKATNEEYVKLFAQKIAGHENEPAGQVFKNVQFLKNTPARLLLVIMNAGYSTALGVSCTYCHKEDDFSSDEKRPKRAAREMQVMHRSVNEQLGKMQNLQSEPKNRFINCSTCHRGAIDPMANDR